MKIQKKTLTNWKIAEPSFQNKMHITGNQKCGQYKDCDLNTMFGLPRSLLESPKLSSLKLMIQTKNSNKIKKLEAEQLGPAGKYYHDNLRSTLMNRTKQLFRPLRKNKSLNETHQNFYKKQRSFKMKQIQANKKLFCNESSPQKTLDLLQKIIFQENDSRDKEQSLLELQANKFPLIQLKKRQNLAAYQSKYLVSNLLSKYETIQSKSPGKIRKIEKPYLSGWETQQQDW